MTNQPETFRALQHFVTNTLQSSYGVMSEPVSFASPIHYEFYLIPPNEDREFWIILTSGLSDIPMFTPPEYNDRQYCELMMFLDPKEWNLNLNCEESGHLFIPDYPKAKVDFRKDPGLRWPMTSLRNLMIMPYKDFTWIGHYHTILIQDLFSAGLYQGFVLRKSEILPEECKTIQVNGRTIHMCVAIPIFVEEWKFANDQGVDELFDLFTENGVDEVTRTYRKSVVQQRSQNGKFDPKMDLYS